MIIWLKTKKNRDILIVVCRPHQYISYPTEETSICKYYNTERLPLSNKILKGSIFYEKIKKTLDIGTYL